MEPGNWLANPEKFEAFTARVADRFRSRREERREFLRAAVEQLDALLAQARELTDGDTEAELSACRAAALAELGDEGLEDSEPSACPPLDAKLTNVETAAPAPETVAAAAPPPASPKAPSAPPPVAPPSPPVPSASPRWRPRERATVEPELETLKTQIKATDASGDAGLLRMKSLACRYRRGVQELEALGVYTGDLRPVKAALQTAVREAHGEVYIAPCDSTVSPEDPREWEDLALGYEGLIPALEAFAWFAEHECEIKPTESRDLLEGIAAAQQRLFRRLERLGAGDDQQKTLYGGLRDCAEALSIFLEALHPSTDEAELARRAARVAKTHRDLRTSVEKRLAQETSLAALKGLIEEPSFGAREADAERLQTAARTCLDAGVPRTKPELRNALLEWEPLLEEGAGLETLCEEIAKERERQAKKGQITAEEDEDRGSKRLPADVEKMRVALLPRTRGKRCLFVGGHVREEHRRRIQEALELEALVWPETDRFDANHHEFDAEIRRSDIVVLLIRFMRTGMKNASELCREEGKSLVRLPRGLNVARVVTDFHEQLIPRAPAR